jgi:hypothetical protein
MHASNTPSSYWYRYTCMQYVCIEHAPLFVTHTAAGLAAVG